MTRLTFLAVVLSLIVPSNVRAQQPDDDAAVFKPAQPDFTLVGLPTGLRLPKFKSAFRVTHRFTRPLGEGDFGSLAEDFFGLDSGAQIGLEYRFGIMRNAQIGINRISNRTIQFFALYDRIRQERLGVEVSALASIDGTNNFKDSYSPALGAVISRTLGEYVGLYVEPIWVNNTNVLPQSVVDHNDTFIIGVGARVRVRPTVYVVGDVSPRASGYKPGVTHGCFGLEKRAGGHVFQVNFSNSFGTTMSQIARGGPEENDWYLGFNISRKFY